MKRIILRFIFASLLFVSCKEEKTQTELIEQYYEVLNGNASSPITTLILDSILTTEGEYKKTFSKGAYIEFLKWDAVFKSEYEILDIKEEEGVVKAKVRHQDLRLDFLHEQAVITNQLFRFKNDKISSAETVNYVVFDDATFIKNRNKLLKWIRENHPELDGFIYDQTEEGGLKYLKAINLYKQAN